MGSVMKNTLHIAVISIILLTTYFFPAGNFVSIEHQPPGLCMLRILHGMDISGSPALAAPDTLTTQESIIPEEFAAMDSTKQAESSSGQLSSTEQSPADSIVTQESTEQTEKKPNSNSARQKAVDFLLDAVGIKMIELAAGSFSMGVAGDSEEGADSTRVTVDAFEISLTEITNAQFCAFLNAIIKKGNILVSNGIVMGLVDDYGGREIINLHGSFNEVNRCWITYRNDTFSVVDGKNNLPVVYVTWYGALTFARNYGLDLPSEAEWEYAARGGLQSRYATWDSKISTAKANYGAFKKEPTAVGSYRPNSFGLFDMGGNVWEWCRDWYDENYSAYRPSENPQGPKFGTSKVFKGGSWISRAHALQCGYSWAYEPSFKYHNIGFRVVRHKNGS